jgi:hypothetical protein
MRRARCVDWYFFEKVSEKTDYQSASKSYIVISSNSTKRTLGNHSGNFEIWIVYYEIDDVKTTHAVSLDKARESRINSGKHSGYLLVMVLDFVVSILLS